MNAALPAVPEAPKPEPQPEIAPYQELYAIELTRLYHDDEPVGGAAYELELENNEKVKGKLDGKGKATIKNLESPPHRVRFGPGAGKYERVDQRKNAHYNPSPKAVESIIFDEPNIIEAQRPSVTELEPDVIEAPGYQLPKSEVKEIVYGVGNWIWGTLKGGFNEQASVSQIIVDAAISMIPIAGDITAARDLVAVVLRLVNHPEKRKEVLEWVTVVLLLFALIPVIGGVVKGVGKLLFKAGEGAGKIAAALRKMIKVANRLGHHDAVVFLRELSVEKYLPELLGHWHSFLQKLDTAFEMALRKGRMLMTESMISHLSKIRTGLKELGELGERMIPEVVKEIGRRLKAVQHVLYEGEWESIKKAAAGRMASKLTREAEARLVATISDERKVTMAWETKHLPNPPNPKSAFIPEEGFPNLKAGDFVKGSGKDVKYEAIAAFSGRMNPVRLKPGTKIYRIVDPDSRDAGLWWSRELPKGGTEWREGFAVLEPWNSNGQYVELIVPESGLMAWEGKVASQIEQDTGAATFGQYLRGGETQLLVDFRFPANEAAAEKISARQATHWNDTIDVNLLDLTWDVQRLGEGEVETKLLPHLPEAAATAEHGVRLHEASGHAH